MQVTETISSTTITIMGKGGNTNTKMIVMDGNGDGKSSSSCNGSCASSSNNTTTATSKTTLTNGNKYSESHNNSFRENGSASNSQEVLIGKRPPNRQTVDGNTDYNIIDNNNNNEMIVPVTHRPSNGNDFYWNHGDEPHAARRIAILKKYPQIKQLYGCDPYLRYQVIAVVIIQIYLSILMKDEPSKFKFFITAYFLGGTMNHMMFMALHELSHNLGFVNQRYNKYFAMFVANLPIGLPAAISFKRYHIDHHRYQGVDGIDVDIPTILEGKIFNNTITKFLFVVFQIVFYAVRPAFVNPKKPGYLEIINTIAVLSFDAILTYCTGSIWPLLYLLLSTFLGGGLHPCAGHFIAEHYVFHTKAENTAGLETYSYYGPLNMFTFNVGYHNEHHDFPFIPGRRLPQVREIASEFYDFIPHHTCWCKVIFDYITNPNVTGFSRVKRRTTSALTVQPTSEPLTTTKTTTKNSTIIIDNPITDSIPTIKTVQQTLSSDEITVKTKNNGGKKNKKKQRK